MSLINQMLRDLEQRNTEKPNSSHELKVKTSANRRDRKLNWIWLLLLIALPPAFVWQHNPTKRTDRQLAVTNSPAVIVEPKSSPIPKVNPQVPEPAPAQVSVQIANPVMMETEKAIGKQEIVSRIPKQAINPIIAKPEKKLISSPQKQVDTLYRQAQTSASFAMTKEILREALRIDPFYLPARTLLLQTLLKSHASDQELADFTENCLQLFPGNLSFIKTRAHLYIQQKNFAAAVNLLERTDSESIEDSHYLSLLAAGYQQLQKFPQSARIYRQLTSIQPDKAENWLGLAIAQDKLNEAGPAIESYRQALNKKTLNSEVVDYIKQRLSVLN